MSNSIVYLIKRCYSANLVQDHLCHKSGVRNKWESVVWPAKHRSQVSWFTLSKWDASWSNSVTEWKWDVIQLHHGFCHFLIANYCNHLRQIRFALVTVTDLIQFFIMMLFCIQPPCTTSCNHLFPYRGELPYNLWSQCNEIEGPLLSIIA